MPNPDPWFFDLSPEERSALPPESIGHYERDLCRDINLGRAMLNGAAGDPPDGHLIPVELGEFDEIENFSTTVSWLLQAGAHAGYDPGEVCARALRELAEWTQYARDHRSRRDQSTRRFFETAKSPDDLRDLDTGDA